jgi:hypothetical protein
MLKIKASRLFEFLYYRSVLIKNRIIRLRYFHSQPTYLFILAPPFSGSTLLTRLLATSSHVSVNNNLGTCEGQQLPELKAMLWERDSGSKYDSATGYDWAFIKSVWHRYWNPSKEILVEKSPPNIARFTQLQDHFLPACFIIMVRNPYAQCESHIKRKNLDGNVSAIAAFVIHCLRLQKINQEMEGQKLSFTYEALVKDPGDLKTRLANFLPQLRDIRMSLKTTPIQDRNDEQISHLSVDQIQQINVVFEKNQDILTYFGYQIIHQHKSGK